jgi:hypothetical protein
MSKSPACPLKRSIGQRWFSAKADKVNRCECETDNRRERSILHETFFREMPRTTLFQAPQSLERSKKHEFPCYSADDNVN